MPENLKAKAQQVLALADVRVNGTRPWDIQVHNDRAFEKIFANAPLNLGETYVDGWWDCKALDEFFSRVLGADLDKNMPITFPIVWGAIRARIFNLQSPKRAFHIGKAHYDLGNDLFELMLDKRMIYSCGYWRRNLASPRFKLGLAKFLDEAQEAKLDLVCKKLGMKKGMRVLDVGCGWGGFAKFAAERYGANVVGITVSKEQARLARETCKGLSVEIRLQDYRELNEQFDRIVSIGMFEHVGYKNYKTFMQAMHKALKGEGLFLLHTIGGNQTIIYASSWVHKYIFPGGMIPSIAQIGKALEGLFVMEDWHNFGADYDKTLMAWHQNFIKNWKKLKPKYGEKFFRIWKYFLLSSAGSFRARKNQLWQIVLSKKGVPGGYQSLHSIRGAS